MEYKDLSDKLDIFLITFNRAKPLNRTLTQLLADDSPIKSYAITIIDNNSTDDTELIVKKHQAQHKNLHYEKNKYNIGANANIVKAFYKAEKEYVWILADDDGYSWAEWSKVEQGIESLSDAIVVASFDCPKYDISQLFFQTTFLPSVIYRTSNIDSTVMGNMEFNISNMFPHLALSAKLINENKKLTILDKTMVLPGENSDKSEHWSYVRDVSGYIHPLQKNTNWIGGFANSLHLIKDEKTRNYIASHNRWPAVLNSARLFFKKGIGAPNSLYTYLCVFNVLSPFDKLRFLLNAFLFWTLYKIIFISHDEHFEDDGTKLITRYDLRLFGFMGTKLFKKTKNINKAQL